MRARIEPTLGALQCTPMGHDVDDVCAVMGDVHGAEGDQDGKGGLRVREPPPDAQDGPRGCKLWITAISQPLTRCVLSMQAFQAVGAGCRKPNGEACVAEESVIFNISLEVRF
jgi:hypothetical protein